MVDYVSLNLTTPPPGSQAPTYARMQHSLRLYKLRCPKTGEVSAVMKVPHSYGACVAHTVVFFDSSGVTTTVCLTDNDSGVEFINSFGFEGEMTKSESVTICGRGGR